jgi:hypothetical protein
VFVLPCLDTQGHGQRKKTIPHSRGVVQAENVPPPRSPGEYPSPMAPRGEKDLSPDYEDDPENGIYWGPKQPNGMMTPWSRPWFDWRSEQATPRKPEAGI